MRSAFLAVVFLAVLGSSTQIVFMDLDEVLPMAGNVLISRVVSIEAFEEDDWCSGDFSLIVLETLYGDVETGAEISCTYHLNFPRICESAGGTVAWVSQDETGSGHEFLVTIGDTVIALLESDYADTTAICTLLRIEPFDMLDVILEKISVAAHGGARLCQTNQTILLGEVFTRGFVYSRGSWRIQELIELSSGTILIWDWTNADEWQDILSITSDTLLITFEVIDIHDIEYRSELPDMPERWKRIYVSRIIDASVF